MAWNDGKQKYNPTQDALEQLGLGFLNDPRIFGAFVAVLALIYGGLSSFYTVQPDEEAVVLRLGEFHSIQPPGLHFKIPFGIDRVKKLRTKAVLQEAFGFYPKGVGTTATSQDILGFRPANGFDRRRQQSRDLKTESLMLTGDLNVADVQWVVHYQISNPRDFLFNVRDPLKNIRDISQATMRQVVGNRTVNDILTVGRAAISDKAKVLTQQILDSYQMGIRIVEVKLQDVNPPEPVQPSFNEVNAAKQEQEQSINQAEAQYNRVIPEARGKADEEISRARGYAKKVLNTAKGDANRFSQVLFEYKKAPQVTRTRMYLEHMQDLVGRIEGLTVVDPQVKGILPVFSDEAAVRSQNSTRSQDIDGSRGKGGGNNE